MLINVTSFNFRELKKFTDHHRNFIDVKNNSLKEVYEGDSLIINAEIYSDLNDLKVSVYARRIGWRGYSEIEMVKSDIYNYHTKLPNDFLNNGIVEYFITVKKDSNIVTFPGEYSIDPNNWRFNAENSYKVLIKPLEDSEILFSPLENKENVIIPNVWFSLKFRNSIELMDSKSYSYVINLNEYSRKINELAVQIYVGDEVRKFGKNKIKQLLLDINLVSEVIDSLELRFIEVGR